MGKVVDTPVKYQKKQTYSEKLKNPKWQKKRLEILQRDEWTCQFCGDTENTLHVHHKYYESGKEPWDYPDNALVVLCAGCHEEETQELKKATQTLIEWVQRCGFTSSDIISIASGFYNLTETMPHLPYVFANAFSFWTLREENTKEMVDYYFECLKKLREEQDA